MTERTLFDAADDTADVAAGSQEGPASHLPRPCVGHVTSSVASTGGAPCREGEGESPSHRPTDSPWRECPHEVFMAMTEFDQLDYCARRDEDSARFAATEDDAVWYRERAAWYRQRMKEI